MKLLFVRLSLLLTLFIMTPIQVYAAPASSVLTPTPISPLKQMKNGVSHDNVSCAYGMYPLQKLSDDSVACVTPYAYDKLFSRIWGTPNFSYSADVNMQIVRWNPNGYINDVNFYPISNETIQKHPILQNPMNEADKQFEKGEKPICGTYKIFTTNPRHFGNQGPPCLHFPVHANLVREILRDQSFKFSPFLGESYDTYVQQGDAKYRIIFFY